MAHRTAASRRGRRLGVAFAAVATTALTALLAVPHADGQPAFTSPNAARAGAPNPANPANPTNPLAGRPWGVYTGAGESPWSAYNGKMAPAVPAPTDAQKPYLQRIVDTPKTRWFSDQMSPSIIRTKLRNTIASTTEVDPSALVQVATFAMQGTWEVNRCPNQTAYKAWSDAFTQTLAAGHVHSAVVVQIDGVLAAACKANRAMVRYTVSHLHAIPNTAIYIEMGSADWPAFVDPAGSLPRTKLAQAVALLIQDGVGMARGFALGTTHFDATGSQLDYGKKLVDALAAKGYRGKHFVVDTSDNGAPFTGAWFHQHFGARTALDQAKPCGSATQTHCVKLGIPPTTDVVNPLWGQTAARNAIAATYVDGFLWIERPWLLPKNVVKGATGDPGFKMTSAVNEAKFARWNPLTQGGTYVVGNPK